MDITEYELKVLEIDIEAMKSRLNKIGATYIWTKNFKRYVYDAKPKEYWRWLRLRTDWSSTELTFKHIVDESAIDWIKEREVKVDNFAMTNLLLEQLWYKPKAFQENIRISYSFNKCDLEIDQWPWIPPYLEIEWSNKSSVEETLKLLELWDAFVTSDNTTKIYQRYGIDNLESIPHLSFEKMK